MLSLTSPTAGALAALSSALAWTVITLMVRNLAPHFSAFSLNIVRAAVGGVAGGADQLGEAVGRDRAAGPEE